ncbi:MAG: glycosyltransferase family 39 protein, partial [Bacteroidota bacterium]|nr:glycosyltransferase family 39 protein [Bacteroidota bacterium]
MKNIINSLVNNKRLPLILFVTAIILFSANIGGMSIYMLDEAKNSECAREMLEQKDFVVPTFNYELRTDKPPLHYYFMMASYKIFGVNEFGARFFSAVFGALTVLITFLYSRRFINKETGLWAAIVLIASIHMVLQFHLAVPDPYLVFFFCWTLFLFIAAYKDRKTWEVYLFYAAAGLGVLAKGPVVVAIPGLAILVFLIMKKQLNWQTIKFFRPWFGILLLLAICLPWYIKVGLDTNWEWTKGFFFQHNLGRFTGEMEGHGGIFLITPGYIILGLFPFSAFIIQAVAKGWKERENDFLFFNWIAA